MTTRESFIEAYNCIAKKHLEEINLIKENKPFYAITHNLTQKAAIEKAFRDTEEYQNFLNTLKEKDDAEQIWRNKQEKFSVKEFLETKELSEIREKYKKADDELGCLRTWYILADWGELPNMIEYDLNGDVLKG
jgi:hypothetical protein